MRFLAAQAYAMHDFLWSRVCVSLHASAHVEDKLTARRSAAMNLCRWGGSRSKRHANRSCRKTRNSNEARGAQRSVAQTVRHGHISDQLRPCQIRWVYRVWAKSGRRWLV